MRRFRLTIALPTFNRADELRDQLRWLDAALTGHEDDCEVVVSDNASTDATPEVIEAWQRGRRGSLTSVRQPRNMGAIANIEWCTRSARGRHVWVVGDDDRVSPAAVGRVLELLDAMPDVGALVLNFSSRDAHTGEQRFERCFDCSGEPVETGGRELYERLLDHPDSSRWGGLGFTTALVLRSDLAWSALDAWPAAARNFSMQLYLSAYCTAEAGMAVTGEVLLECVAGTHYFVGDRANQARYQLAQVPAAMARLAVLGYEPHVLRRRVVDKLRVYGPAAVLTAPRYPLRNAGALLRWAASAGSLALPRRRHGRRMDPVTQTSRRPSLGGGADRERCNEGSDDVQDRPNEDGGSLSGSHEGRMVPMGCDNRPGRQPT